MKAPVTSDSIESRHLYRRMREIENLPCYGQAALLRTIEEFIPKTVEGSKP